MSASAASSRFLDDGRRVFSFADEILVRCPKCGEAGKVLPVAVAQTPSKPDTFAPRQFRCPKCFHQIENRGAIITFRKDARDPYLGLPLLLGTRTRHGLLFAYNGRHLDWIEAFVSARLRERRLGEGMVSRSAVSRLPRWVKAAGHREEILRAIARLRKLSVDALKLQRPNPS